jgi:uncharacterized protein YhfF
VKFPVVNGLRALELGTPGPMRARLNDLVLAGAKRATAGTLDDYEDNECEFVGEHLALVSDDLEMVGEVEVTATATATFGTVPWSFAAAEGEGDESIEQWRSGHRAFWQAQGIAVSDDTPVWLIYFRLVKPLRRDGAPPGP